MTNEFKKIKLKTETRYVLENASGGASAGGTSAASVNGAGASPTSSLGVLRRRLKELQDKVIRVKGTGTGGQRNTVAQGIIRQGGQSGAGAHQNKRAKATTGSGKGSRDFKKFHSGMDEDRNEETGNTLYLKFKLHRGNWIAYAGYALSPKDLQYKTEIQRSEAIITKLNDLDRFINHLKSQDDFNKRDRIIIVANSKIYNDDGYPEHISEFLQMVQDDLYDNVMLKMVDPVEKDGRGSASAKRPNFQMGGKTAEQKPVVRFTVVDPRMKQQMKDAGIPMEGDAFVMPPEKYQAFLEKLKQATKKDPSMFIKRMNEEDDLDEQSIFYGSDKPAQPWHSIEKILGKSTSMENQDHEISMASSELQSIVTDAADLLDMIKQRSEEEGLEAWQQSKITKAADFMNSVLQSIKGDEEDDNNNNRLIVAPVNEQGVAEDTGDPKFDAMMGQIKRTATQLEPNEINYFQRMDLLFAKLGDLGRKITITPKAWETYEEAMIDGDHDFILEWIERHLTRTANATHQEIINLTNIINAIGDGANTIVDFAYMVDDGGWEELENAWKNYKSEYARTGGINPIVREQGVAEGALNEFDPGGIKLPPGIKKSSGGGGDDGERPNNHFVVFQFNETGQIMTPAIMFDNKKNALEFIEDSSDIGAVVIQYVYGFPKTVVRKSWEEDWGDENRSRIVKKLKTTFKDLITAFQGPFKHEGGYYESQQSVSEVRTRLAKRVRTRLDPKCWSNKKIGNPKTKMKGGVRVNNCVPKEGMSEDNSGLESYQERALTKAFRHYWTGGSVEKAIRRSIDSLYAAQYLTNDQFDAAEEFLYHVADMEQGHDKPHFDHEEDSMGLGLFHDSSKGVAEGSDVTDYNPTSQGGTRKELLAKYHKTKDPKDAEAARRAGATQKELQGVAEGDEPGYTKYEQMKDKIASVLIKLYHQGNDKETIKQMKDRFANHLGYDPDDSIFHNAWMSVFTDASLDGSLDQDPKDDDTDQRMRDREGRFRDQYFENLSAKLESVINHNIPEGWENTIKAMKKHPELTKGKTKAGKKKNVFALANWMKSQGYKSHK